MSVSHIPNRTKLLLWIKSGGICQYKGCTEKLYLDILTKRQYNKAYIAHIVADSVLGPRGDKKLSKKLSKEESNLMLLCDSHHRLIDKVDVSGHTVKILTKMKKDHEKRISRLCSIKEDLQSHIVVYRSNIGKHTPVLNYKTTVPFVTKEFYPATDDVIDLSLSNSSFEDNEKEFWKIERKNLERQFRDQIQFKLKQGKITHISLFAFAPMPLLILLGTLINDIQKTKVYQPVRNPKTWLLKNVKTPIHYKILRPKKRTKVVAINISLSASINNDRITKVLGNKISIYTLTIPKPFNDFVKSKNQVLEFSKVISLLFNEIRKEHPSSEYINIFPSMPVVLAIELGRRWMPKADLPIKIFDQNKSFDFYETIKII